MKIIESSREAYRYLWSPVRNEDRFSRFLAGRNIAVGHLEPGEMGQRLLDLKAVASAQSQLAGKPGSLELVELSERADYLLNAHLASTLAPVTGRRRAKYINPGVGLVCGATQYHVDMPWSGCIFGAWCLQGPERIVRFSEMDIEVPFMPGTVVLFDPAQPHALLRPGATAYAVEEYQEGQICAFLSFSVKKEPRICEAMDVQVYGPRKHAGIRTTVRQYRPCPLTGQLQYQE